MIEVEVKVPADLDAVRARLRVLDAESRGTVVQRDTYYDSPVASFVETDEALRLRAERPVDADVEGVSDSEDGAGPPRERGRGVDQSWSETLTYKGPRLDDDSKSRTEIETAVADGSATDELLRSLEFTPAATVAKTRERYRLDGFTVTLDDVDSVGEYVEVERTVSRSALDRTREAGFGLLERLDLDPDDQVQASYLALRSEEA